MKLLDLYKELCNDKTFFERYYSTSGSNYGKIFFFISTNYRGILIKSGNRLQGFANGFRVIENVEGKNVLIGQGVWGHSKKLKSNM